MGADAISATLTLDIIILIREGGRRKRSFASYLLWMWTSWPGSTACGSTSAAGDRRHRRGPGRGRRGGHGVDTEVRSGVLRGEPRTLQARQVTVPGRRRGESLATRLARIRLGLTYKYQNKK